jgi:DNA-binding transcriptional MocR family regulator
MTTVQSTPGDAADARWLAHRIAGLRPADIHRDIASLIDERALVPGQQLPTVRDVATELGVSVGTVSGAWARLRRDGFLITRRRGGTTVAPPQSRRSDPTFDLVRAEGDPALLPDLDEVLAQVSAHGAPDRARSITTELRRTATRRWPYPPPELLAVRGVRAALHLITRALLQPEAPIAVADPVSRRTADALRGTDRVILPVLHDEHGPLPESLAGAIGAGASLFCLEPASVLSAETAASATRTEELARVIRGAEPELLVFEEDPAAGFAHGVSLGAMLPERVLRTATYARAFGGDLSVAVLSGPSEAIGRLGDLQAREGARAGVLDQRLLARLLADRSASARARSALEVYRRRNDALKGLLRMSGLDVRGNDFYLWVPVVDEAAAVTMLARHAVQVSPGAESSLSPDTGPRIRVATTRLPTGARDLEQLAALIAAAARPPSGARMRESSRRSE